MRKKVTVVGGGFVGSTTAQRIHDAGLADVVLTDILDGVPAGKALDMAESAPIMGSDAHAAGISTASGRLQRHREQRHHRHHRRFPAQAGNEPRRFAESELRRDQRRRGSSREALAESDFDCGHQSAGRDGAGCVQNQQISQERA